MPQESVIFKFNESRPTWSITKYLNKTYALLVPLHVGEPHIDGEPGDLKFRIQELRLVGQ